MTEKAVCWEDVFPHPPYQMQSQLADAILTAIHKQQHKLLLIESPTGTGKTYSLLASTLHWLTHPSSAPTSSLPSWLTRSKLQHLSSKHQSRLSTMTDISTFKQNQHSFQTIKSTIQGVKKLHSAQYSREQDDSFKIIYASRTHSQLQQVVRSAQEIAKKMKIKVNSVHLASKEHTCIRPAFKSQPNITQKCRQLLEKSKCEYHHNGQLTDFLNLSLAESIALGSAHGVCPYYGIRNITSCCDLICVPYPTLLDADIRSKCGISLCNSIVVMDEAHNILDVDLKMRSPQITYLEIIALCQCLDEYLDKIRDKHLLQKWLSILRALIQAAQHYIAQMSSINTPQPYIRVQIIQWLLAMGLSEMSMWKIRQYVQANDIDSRLATKQLSIRGINNIIDFLMKISTHSSSEKSTVLVKGKCMAQCKIKLLCLQSSALRDIITMSKLTIMAGGTMQPIDDFSALLVNIPHQVYKFKHIIKRSQFPIHCITKYNDKQIKFTLQSLTKDKALVMEVVNETVKKVIGLTEEDGGIVVFVQNYKMVAMVREHLDLRCKIIYDDSLGKAFAEYKAIIDDGRQAVLVSVMGGKLSEGINFSDRYARALVVLGLPYPNLCAPQIKEMMQFHHPKPYYEHLCAKTLNQTIGRAVRHINDHAHCYLVDARFRTIRNQLSQWMRDKVEEGWG